MFLAENHEVLFELLHVTSMNMILKTGVPQMNHFISERKKNQISQVREVVVMHSGPLGCGEDQEAGEGVARAALTNDGVEPADLQRHRVSGLQIQHRRTGGDQKPLRRVALCQLDVAVFH